jgi:hypothetical protein
LKRGVRMITWAFAYMHVHGPHPIGGFVFFAVVVVDILLIAMLAGTGKKNNK